MEKLIVALLETAERGSVAIAGRRQADTSEAFQAFLLTTSPGGKGVAFWAAIEETDAVCPSA